MALSEQAQLVSDQAKTLFAKLTGDHMPQLADALGEMLDRQLAVVQGVAASSPEASAAMLALAPDILTTPILNPEV